MKKLIALMLVLALAFAFAACNNSTTPTDGDVDADANDLVNELDQDIFTMPETLKLGLDASFPPMGFTDETGAIVGFDIDLAQAVCDYYGIELECIPIEWDNKDAELATGTIDCIWNGLTITDERLENYCMSRPYLANRQVVVVTNDSEIATLADLAGKTVALQSDSSASEALEANEEVNSSIAQKVELLDNLTALMDLQAGNVDAVILDEVVANYVITENGYPLTVLEESLAPEEYGIGFAKESTDLCAAVEAALDTLKADGTLAEISVKWFGEDKVIF
ncbi:MAG: amino acid ABC transporter substrate-binding protein [Oscillospiraceae bacterium]|nr:amino acid ABC transporter substrate-binding protein [Oscillospiraceae bacterium]